MWKNCICYDIIKEFEESANLNLVKVELGLDDFDETILCGAYAELDVELSFKDWHNF